MNINDQFINRMLIEDPNLKQYVFKVNKKPQDQIDKACYYNKVYFKFKETQEEFNKVGKDFIETYLLDQMQQEFTRKRVDIKGKTKTQLDQLLENEAPELERSLEERHKTFEPAISKYNEGNALQEADKIFKKVYVQELEGLRGREFVGDKYHLTQAVLDYLEGHWTIKLFKGFEERKLENWERDYQELLQKQLTRGVHPSQEGNPDIFWNTADSFYQIFLKTPEDLRQDLLKKPLLPEAEHTQALYYFIFTGHINALEAISPYLGEEDWLCRGPFKATLMHCLISGLERNVTKNGKPVECMELLLKKFPKMKDISDEFGNSPKKYLEHVLPKLNRNLDRIESAPGNMTGHATIKDSIGGRYYETYGEIFATIHDCKKILKLL